jgi:hypothetical protein
MVVDALQPDIQRPRWHRLTSGLVALMLASAWAFAPLSLSGLHTQMETPLAEASEFLDKELYDDALRLVEFRDKEFTGGATTTPDTDDAAATVVLAPVGVAPLTDVVVLGPPEPDGAAVAAAYQQWRARALGCRGPPARRL